MTLINYIHKNKSKLIGIKNYFPVNIFDMLNNLPFNIEPEIHIYGKTVKKYYSVSDVSEFQKHFTHEVPQQKQ